jgi:D-3-phosphoglycerate dehydrogenase
MARRPRILLGESRFSDDAREILALAGDVLEYDSRDVFLSRLAEADALVVGLELILSKQILDRAPNLRVVASRTSQVLHIDMVEAERRGIDVLTNDPSDSVVRDTSSTAELTFALVLALARRIPWAFDSLKDGRWERRRHAGIELAGKTLGVVGYGRLGRKVAGFGRAFGMRVLAHDPGVPDSAIAADDVEPATLTALLEAADVVSLHAGLPPDGRPILRAEQFARMRSSALFVNTARGELTDEAALLTALVEGRIAAAAIDTLAGEDPGGAHLAGNPLVEYARRNENLLLVPHLGGATEEATARTQVYIAERLVRHLAGLARSA